MDLNGAAAELLPAILLANEGKSSVSSAVSSLMRRPHLLSDSYWGKLTAAETRVLALAGGGLSDKEVATTLDISTSTAHTHRRNTMRKLGLHSHAAIMAYSAKKGLVRYVSDRVLRPGFDFEQLEPSVGL